MSERVTPHQQCVSRSRATIMLPEPRPDPGMQGAQERCLLNG